MWKQLGSFFGFALTLIIVAAVSRLSAQREPELVLPSKLEARLVKIESDVDFMAVVITELQDEVRKLKKQE